MVEALRPKHAVDGKLRCWGLYGLFSPFEFGQKGKSLIISELFGSLALIVVAEFRQIQTYFSFIRPRSILITQPFAYFGGYSKIRKRLFSVGDEEVVRGEVRKTWQQTRSSSSHSQIVP